MKRSICSLAFSVVAMSVAPAPSWAQAYTITTVAGGIPQPTPGTGVGDGGQATKAFLNEPSGVAVDSAGNLYIADPGDALIRKVSPSGVISSIAGDATGFRSGYAGDGGPATSALLNEPFGVAVDNTGNIYIADTFNNRIRKISSSGTITTVAGGGAASIGGVGDGGPATQATLSLPEGVAVDAAGNIYIAETLGFRVRKVATDGTISTIAGAGLLGSLSGLGDGGPATKAFVGPYGVAVDGSGNVYIADWSNNRIRKVAPTGIITTVAGSGSGSYSGDGGPATQAGLSQPQGVAVDGAGNLYISDTGDQRIRMVTPDGTISTIAGNGAVGSTGDGGAATSASLNAPFGITISSSGRIYFADSGLAGGSAIITDWRIRALSSPASLPPTVTSGGIVPVYSTSSTIQPGEWVSIYGTNLAGSTATWKGDFPTSLGGTSVTINGKAAYLWFVSPGQINLQAPNDNATGPVAVVVNTGTGSFTSTVTLGQFAPSFSLLDSKHVTGIILRSNGSGAYGGGAYDIIGPTGSSFGYPTVAARAGDTVELFGVGFGPTNPAVPAGQVFSGAAQTTNSVSLTINKVNVIPTFSGLSSAGLYQINLTVPSGLGTGDVALQATVGGVQTPSGVVVSLQ